ncbi:hypothetical protein KUCAC02_025202, partial [Chaenocephalus aceratus]
MGTILQERAPQQHAERVSIIRDRKNNNTPNVASSRMGRRQTQRKPVQPQYMLPSQENMNEKLPLITELRDPRSQRAILRLLQRTDLLSIKNTAV